MMKKTVFLVLLGAFLMALFFVALGNVNGKSLEMPPGDTIQQIYSVPMPEKVTFCGTPVPTNLYYVQEALERELITNTYMHGTTLQIIKRAQRYFDVIDPILKKNNIPNDMKYLAVAESGLRNVVSPSKAEGIWQFLKETGKEYGLEVTNEVDERYHLEKATQAACDYLNKSYHNYKDWALVAAAYNAGNGRVNECQNNQKTCDYYNMFFNPETARYVYRIIALKTILENPQQYGFFVKKSDIYPIIPAETVKIDTAILSLVNFSITKDIPYFVLKEFNPWLRASDLPNKSGKKYELLIPKKDYLDYNKKLKKSTDEGWFEGY